MGDCSNLVIAALQSKIVRVVLLDESGAQIEGVAPQPFGGLNTLNYYAFGAFPKSVNVGGVGYVDDQWTLLYVQMFDAAHLARAGDSLTITHTVNFGAEKTPFTAVPPPAPPKEEKEEEKLPDGTKRVIDL